MAVPKTLKLNDGNEIPAVHFGTFYQNRQATEKQTIINAYKQAIAAGHRAFDTATSYGIEEEVGTAIKESGIPREEFYITTKLPNWGHKKVAEEIDISLKKLQTEYVDLYLIHWPLLEDKNEQGEIVDVDLDWNVADTWKQLEEVQAAGKAKSIGVSNFDSTHLEQVLKVAKVVPAINQVELNPNLPQTKLYEYQKSKGILLEAYSPAGGRSAPGKVNVRENTVIQEIAKKHNASVTQVLLSFGVLRGYPVVANSYNAERVKQLLEPVELSQEEIQQLIAIGANSASRRIRPDTKWPLFRDGDN